MSSLPSHRRRSLSNSLLLGLVALLLFLHRDGLSSILSMNEGGVAVSKGDVSGGLLHIERSLLHDPANSRAYYWLGTIQMVQGFSQAAESALIRAVDLQPSGLPARLQLAELNLRSGQIDLALEQRWEATQGLSALTRARLAGMLCPRHVAACVHEFDRLLTMPSLSDPDRRVIYHEALDSLAVIRSRPDAERYARDAVRLFPEDAYFHWQWANTLLFDQPEEALKEAQQVEELRYDQAATYELFGKIYRRMGRWELAVAAFERSLKFGGSNSWARFWLGEAYWKVGRTADAIREWQTALRLAPGFQEPLRALESAGVRP
jgi:tetratricopeptide (TPR) repeat protein